MVNNFRNFVFCFLFLENFYSRILVGVVNLLLVLQLVFRHLH